MAGVVVFNVEVEELGVGSDNGWDADTLSCIEDDVGNDVDKLGVFAGVDLVVVGGNEDNVSTGVDLVVVGGNEDNVFIGVDLVVVGGNEDNVSTGVDLVVVGGNEDNVFTGVDLVVVGGNEDDVGLAKLVDGEVDDVEAWRYRDENGGDNILSPGLTLHLFSMGWSEALTYIQCPEYISSYVPNLVLYLNIAPWQPAK